MFVVETHDGAAVLWCAHHTGQAMSGPHGTQCSTNYQRSLDRAHHCGQQLAPSCAAYPPTDCESPHHRPCAMQHAFGTTPHMHSQVTHTRAESFSAHTCCVAHPSTQDRPPEHATAHAATANLNTQCLTHRHTHRHTHAQTHMRTLQKTPRQRWSKSPRSVFPCALNDTLNWAHTHTHTRTTHIRRQFFAALQHNTTQFKPTPPSQPRKSMVGKANNTLHRCL